MSDKSFGSADGPTKPSRDSDRKTEVEKAAKGTPAERDPRITFEVPEEKWEAFDEAVDEMDTTKKAVLNRAIDQFVDHVRENGPPDFF